MDIRRITGGLLVGSGGQPPIHEDTDQYVQNLAFLHDKFEILGSQKQLKWDFGRWAPKCDHNSRPLSLVYFDIDNFKRLNSQYSETMVDEYVLKPYQRLVNSSTQHKGFAYAEGGDEIILLLPNHLLDEAGVVADELRGKTEKTIFTINEKNESFTISLGVAERMKGEDLSEVKLRANRAKQLAKENGKNIVCMVDVRSKLSKTAFLRDRKKIG